MRSQVAIQAHNILPSAISPQLNTSKKLKKNINLRMNRVSFGLTSII